MQLLHKLAGRGGLKLQAPTETKQRPASGRAGHGRAGSHGGRTLCPGTRRRLGSAAASALPPAAVSQPLLAEPWLVVAGLTSCGAVSQLLEGRTRLGALLSAPMMTLCLGLAGAAGGLLPCSCAVYDAVWEYVMPLAAGLFMLEHDVSRLRGAGGPVLGAFLLGALGMLAGALLSWLTVGRWMGPHGPQLAACLCASYIGGSINFAAVAKALSLPAATLPGAMAADNLAMAALLAALMTCPLHLLSRKPPPAAAAEPARAAAAAGLGSAGPQPPGTAAAAAAAAAAPGGPRQQQGQGQQQQQQQQRSGQMARDGQPLLTEEPSATQVAACMAAAKSGRGGGAPELRLPPNISPNGSLSSGSFDGEDLNSSSSSSSSSSGGGASGRSGGSSGGPLALDGQPLLTELPATADVFAALQAARRGERSPGSSRDGGSPSSSNSSSWDGGDDAGAGTRAPAAAAAVTAAHMAAAGRRNGSSKRSGAAAAAAGHERSMNGRTAAGAHDSLYSKNSSSSSSSSNGQEGPSHAGHVGRAGASSLHPPAAGATAPSSRSSAAAAAAGSSPARAVGALAFDGSPLLTEEPPPSSLASALRHAKGGSGSSSRSGSSSSSVSVSVSVSSLSSMGSMSSLDSSDGEQHGAWCPPEPPQELLARKQGPAAAAAAAAAAADRGKGQEELTWEAVMGAGAPAQRKAARSSRRRQQQRSPGDSSTPALQAASSGAVGSSVGGAAPTTESLAAALAAAAVAVAAGKQVSAALGAPGLHLMAMALVAMGLAAAAAAWQQQQQQGQGKDAARLASGAPLFGGASQLGGALMLPFFATIGASSGSLASLGSSGPLLAFIGVMVAAHWALLGAAGRLLGLQPRLLLLGSNANIGGPATAAGLAQSRGWDDLVQPAMLCGSLGYALGTGAGLLLAHLAGA